MSEPLDVFKSEPIPNAKARLFAAAPEEMAESWKGYEDHFVWSKDWRGVPFAALQKAFSLEEMFRMWRVEFIANGVDEEFQYEPLYQVLHRLQFSQFVAGHYTKDVVTETNAFIRLYNGLSRFSFGLPGFEAFLTYTRSVNPMGPSVHGRPLHRGDPDHSVYLDGVFAYNIVYKGERVLTISFYLSSEGVQVVQVQTQGPKRGNRWLFKLPCFYLDHAVERLAAAWPDFDVWMVQGQSTVHMIQSNYGGTAKIQEKYPANHWDRIAAFYDRPLRSFTRSTEVRGVRGRYFFKLQRLPSPEG